LIYLQYIFQTVQTQIRGPSDQALNSLKIYSGLSTAGYQVEMINEAQNVECR